MDDRNKSEREIGMSLALAGQMNIHIVKISEIEEIEDYLS